MKKQVALTIAGGGVRSTAAIGVIEYLEENEVKIDAISGTSAGAIIAILYSYGVPTDEIKEVIDDMKFKDFIDVSFNKFMSLNSMERMLNYKLENRERIIPVEIAITNEKTMEVKYFKNKEKEVMIKAVLASSSLKGVFSAVKIDNVKYRDGGYSNNMPYINFHNENYLTIAVVTNYEKKKKTMMRKACKKRIKYPNMEPDYLIKVNNIQNITTFQLEKTSFIMKNGYRIARDTLDIKEIKERISS